MGSPELDNLLRIGKLKAEPGARREIEDLIRAGESRLADARNENLAIESRFDLAYNAAHARPWPRPSSRSGPPPRDT